MMCKYNTNICIYIYIYVLVVVQDRQQGAELRTLAQQPAGPPELDPAGLRTSITTISIITIIVIIIIICSSIIIIIISSSSSILMGSTLMGLLQK